MTTKVCTGPCGRTLPRTVAHFYVQRSLGDGLTPRCRDCVKAAERERRAAERERRAAEPPPIKRCIGPCGRELPGDAAHFARDPLDRPRPHCRQCELAAALARPPSAPPTKTCIGHCGRELPGDREHFYRSSKSRDGLNSRCRDCISGDARDRRAAKLPAPPKVDALATAEAARVADELAAALDALRELPGGGGEPISFSSREGRLSFIRRRIETAPPGQAAEAADRARRVLAASDKARAEAIRPPFNSAADVFLDMAEAASDEGVKVLGAGLRGLGWTHDPSG